VKRSIGSIRSEFPQLQKTIRGKPLIYLDSAATSLKPKCVIERLCRFYEEEYATVHRAIYSLSQEATQEYSSARETVREFLGAKNTEEIVFTKGTTESINLVASSFGSLLQKGDEIILTEMEHHSNLVPWQLLAEKKGIVLKFIPINEKAELQLDHFEKLLSDRTKLVSLAHIANSTGTLNPIETIISLAHAKGAKVFIDGAQSASHMPVNVQALDADFYAFSGHKAFGPTGIGVLYGKKELLDLMPPYQSGGDMIEKVTLEKTTFQKAPLKFEAGTPPIAEVIALKEALLFIESIGREEIVAFEKKLLAHATQKLQEIPGLRIIGTAERKGAIISFSIEGVHPLDLGTLLDLQGIALRTGHLCAQPTLQKFGVSQLTRASFAPYNTLEEIDVFVSTLKEVVSTLR
jgi:cysteine desulfurase / selenocysteine lyase